MFIRFFKTHQPASLFAIPLVVLLLWIPAWISPAAFIPAGEMPLYKLTLLLLSHIPSWSHAIIGAALVTFQALYLNYIVNQQEVLYRKSYLPGLFFALFFCSLPSFLWLHPAIFATCLLVITLGRIFNLYKNDASLPVTFDIGFLLALATLFYFPAIIFMLLFYFSLVILRPFIWREWIVPLVGFALPNVFIGLYFFWFDRSSEFLSFFSPEMFYEGDWKSRFAFPMDEATFGFIVVFLLLLAFNKLARNFFRNVIRTRSYQQVFLTMLVLLLIPLIFFSGIGREYFSLFSIPLSVFIGYYFLAIKRMWWSELLFLILLGSLIMLHIR